VDEWEEVAMPQVKLAAIDNGLAFPFKHPDEWRSYPYGWSHLSYANVRFSEATVAKILPMLENADFVLEIGRDLRKVFKKDRGFDKKMFGKQLSVMYGQIYNLIHALRQQMKPVELVQMPPIYMVEIKKKKKKRNKRHDNANHDDHPSPSAEEDTLSELSTNSRRSATAPTPTTWETAFEQKVHTRYPFFSCV